MPKFVADPEKAKEKTKDALSLLEKGIEALNNDEAWIKYLKFQAKFHRYSFGNVVMIASQFPTASRVAGFHKWKELNRSVKKGEKGIIILAPCPVRIEDAEGEEKTFMRFKTASVFDVSQTEGEELPTICRALQGDDRGLGEKLKAYARTLNIPVDLSLSLGETKGRCYFGSPIRIELNAFNEPLQQAKTLTHELAHALMHTEEEYRGHDKGSQRELEAESVAFLVLDAFGLNSGSYSFAYIASHNQGNPDEAKKQLKASGKRIQATAHQIIEFLEQPT